MWALLIPLLAQLPGLIGNFFKQQNDLMSAKVEAERQIELAKQSMAMEIAKSQAELGKAVVSSTSSNFKYITFFMWFGPYIIGTFFPKYGAEIFNNWLGMPPWYAQSCVILMFAVWGISCSAPTVANVFSNLGTFFASRRDYKLEMAKVNRKAYYAALRALKGVVTPDDVKQGEKLLDEMDVENGNS